MHRHQSLPLTRWLGRAFALGFGLLVAWGLIEAAGRLFFGFEPLPGWAQTFNSLVGYELRPDQAYIYTSARGEFDTVVRHNSRGLHDIEHTLDKPADVFRILILADSYGHAREVPIERNFARQLETLLNHITPTGRKIEVINAGHFGLGTTQEYLYYTVEGVQYDPDLVLVGFYVGNDVVDNHAPLSKAWNTMDTIEFPYFSPDGVLHQPGMAARRRALSWMRQNLYTVNVLASAWSGTGQTDHVTVGGADANAPSKLRVPMGIYLPPDTTWDQGWTVTGHALQTLKHVVEAEGRQLGVFVIPDRRQVSDADWQAALAALPDLDPSALNRERPTQRIMALLDSLSIPALSLLGPFRTADERLYFEFDGHFNEEGHTHTARLLAEWVVETGLIRQSQ